MLKFVHLLRFQSNFGPRNLRMSQGIIVSTICRGKREGNWNNEKFKIMIKFMSFRSHYYLNKKLTYCDDLWQMSSKANRRISCDALSKHFSTTFDEYFCCDSWTTLQTTNSVNILTCCGAHEPEIYLKKYFS